MFKILIIRFSSFGDIVQSLSCLPLFKEKYPDSEIDFLTRQEFAELLEINPLINKVLKIDRQLGFWDLLKMIFKLRSENYNIIYDSHRSLRSFFLRLIMLGVGPAILPDLFVSPHFLTRSKERIKRILLFNFRINLFPLPYLGMVSYMKPLNILGVNHKLIPQKWNFNSSIKNKLNLLLGDAYNQIGQMICLAPSAAWEMKRWPLGHFEKLIQLLPQHKFLVLGGKEDLFCMKLKEIAPTRVHDLIGKLSLIESCFVVAHCKVLVSADTGLLHVADLFGQKGIALIGPTAFGHTTGDWIKEMSVELPCRPCTKDGRGKCSQKVYQKCMVDILPEQVAKKFYDLS